MITETTSSFTNMADTFIYSTPNSVMSPQFHAQVASEYELAESSITSVLTPFVNSTSIIDGVNSASQGENFSMGIGTAEHNSTSLDNSSIPEMPIDMQFNEGHMLAIVIYSLLMIFSSVGNISVFTAIIRLRMKGRLSRINLFLLHLAIADLLVTFLMMPLEIIWNATVTWRAGDLMCRIMSFFRIFGLYLSGFVLVCISLDRYFAVLKPLAMPEANSRGRHMLTVAWLASILCSLPQSFIFHVETHPDFSDYVQCVTFNSFPSPGYELAYNFFGFLFLYGLPLIMIVFCYSRILFEIYRINALKRNEGLRRSNMGALGRAKIRTLKMTVIIVATFFFCYTPYHVMSLWYWFDKNSALKVDQRIQKGLFLFACTNSCVNPLIYGLFHFRPRQKTNSTTMPRSLPNGYNKPHLQSETYKGRVRWKPEECCVMGCRTTGSSETTAAAPSAFRIRGDTRIQIQMHQAPKPSRSGCNQVRQCRLAVNESELQSLKPNFGACNGHSPPDCPIKRVQNHSRHLKCNSFHPVDLCGTHKQRESN